MIAGNKSAAVWVSAQPSGSVTYVTSNLMKGNGAGISTASGGDVALFDNDMKRQMPRLLDGDVTLQFRNIIKDLEGKSPVLLNARGTWPAFNLEPVDCIGRSF